MLGKISPYISRNKRLPKEFSALYSDLYSLAKELKPPISYFRPFEGLWFRDCETKLLLVGRAENNWTTFKEKDVKRFLSNVNFLNKTGMTWLTTFGVSRKEFINYKSGVSYRRNINKEVFWQNGRTILQFLTMDKTLWPPWFENVAWTNLFPLASSDKDYVTEFQKSYQLETAKKLLLAQIDYFNPTHIVFSTGWDNWFSCFAESFPQIKRTETDYPILAFGTYNGAKLCVLEPQEAIDSTKLNMLFDKQP